MKNLTIVSLFFLSIFTGFAQDFNAIADEISNNLQTVTSGKKEYQQELNVISPGVASFDITQVDSKGNTHKTTYEFNFADIDKNTVKPKTKKDLIVVNLYASKKQKLIKKTIDDERVSYVDNFQIYATNIENGRTLADLIKKAIPVSKSILEKRLSLSGYNDRLDWIVSHVGEVNLGDKQFTQSLSVNDKFPGSMNFEKITQSGKTEKDNNFLFNLSTLNPKQINFEIKGNVFGLKVNTKRNLKVIKKLENKNPKSYTNTFTIVCNNIEEARDLQKVLTDIIPLAKEKFEKSIPTTSNLNNGYETINSLVNVVDEGTGKYEQNFEGDCVVKFTINGETSKKTYTEEYDFNWMDLNKNQIKIVNKGKSLVLDVKTAGGKKFIKHLKDEKLNNYTNGFKIYVPGIEEALIVQKTMEKMIDICVENDKKAGNTPMNFSQAINLLNDNVKSFEEAEISYEQSIELQDNNKVLHYKKTIVGSKSSKDLIYEVNLEDLNPKSVNIKVTGKKVSVEVKTNHLEKIIQFYKDDKIQAYQNKFEIAAPDIETARKIKKAMIKISGKK